MLISWGAFRSFIQTLLKRVSSGSVPTGSEEHTVAEYSCCDSCLSYCGLFASLTTLFSSFSSTGGTPVSTILRTEA